MHALLSSPTCAVLPCVTRFPSSLPLFSSFGSPSPALQLMVLLTAGLRPANPREIKLQCLEGWHGLVRALAAEAPVQLGGIVNQVGGM